jgi:hypothetical protein
MNRNRLQADVTEVLAQSRPLGVWNPAVGDFIIWHGWLYGRWYGIINRIERDKLYVIKDNLPKLLLTMAESDYEKNTIFESASKIKASVAGTYHVLQNNVWYIDQ